MNRKENSSNHIPHGDYPVEVENLWIGRAEANNASSPVAFDWQCRILTGDFADEIIHHWVEATDENIGVIKEDLRLIGLNDASLNDVRLVQEDAAGLNCVLKLETTNDQNHFHSRFISRLNDEINLSARLKEAKEKSKEAKPAETFG